MALKIKQDQSRFKSIVRGKIRQNLRKYISNGDLMGGYGGDKISVPLPQIDLPKFTFDHRDRGGVGQGPGEPGDQLAPGNVDEGPGQGEGAGSDAGEHALEVDVTIEELAQMLGEELSLPRIEPKGSEQISNTNLRYSGVRHVGPESLRHFKRTFKRALRREVSSGEYNPTNPTIVPTHDDRRYRSWKNIDKPETNAVIIYMMDVSGSMGEEQKEIVRIESFWIDTWLKSQYKGLQTRFIIHDARAKEVDRDTFFRTRESGGTMISTAYKLCAQMIEDDYPSDEWNIYPFHFSDGDNWSADDTRECMEILRHRIMPRSNVFCYGQVESPYGSGQFIKDLRERYGEDPQMITSEIANKDAICRSIQDFLGKGK